MKYKLILGISILLFITSFWFYLGSFKRVSNTNIEEIINFNNVNFAKEKVSFDGKYYFNREKFEKELSIVRYNFYQAILYHKREPLYIPYIEKELKEAGIPDDFKYLAIAESALKNDALSDSNAGGIWQFIPETAKQYGLIVNENIDERYDFKKETSAAIKYFKKLYNDFHNRTLVAAAYNRGENGLKRALEEQGVNSYYDLYINEETSRYVFRILAIKYIMENRYKVFDKDELGEQFMPPKTKEIQASNIEDLKKWSQEKGYNYATIKQLNPWIISNKIPSGDWKILILDY